MNSQYEVLSPWAEIDPIPLQGISPRLTDLNGKHIGLLANGKRASHPIQAVVARQLKARYPDIRLSNFEPDTGAEADEVERREKSSLENWAKGVDAVILAVGD